MRKRAFFSVVLVVLLVIAGGVYGYYRSKYPYGSTHRCSKSLAPMLEDYAYEHDGRYPVGDGPEHLGMEKALYPPGEFLDLVVGKAGDLDEAEEFFRKNGYLLKEHSSWHYVQGLTVDDVDRALAWDKIPLTHNGMRVSYNPREVIMVGGIVEQVNESEWDQFLKTQEELAAKDGRPD